jgi:hypothetical protein
MMTMVAVDGEIDDGGKFSDQVTEIAVVSSGLAVVIQPKELTDHVMIHG